MKHYFTLVLLLIAVSVASCARMKKFERIESTENDRYSIVYKDGKCGVYDNNADSLVTFIKYDKLTYGRIASEEDIEFTVWGCVVEGCQGMLSIGCETNERIEIIFPKTE